MSSIDVAKSCHSGPKAQLSSGPAMSRLELESQRGREDSLPECVRVSLLCMVTAAFVTLEWKTVTAVACRCWSSFFRDQSTRKVCNGADDRNSLVRWPR